MSGGNGGAHPPVAASAPEKTTAPIVPASPVIVKLDPETLALLGHIDDLLNYQADLLAEIHQQVNRITTLMP